MISFDFDEYCCGCGSCMNGCPVGAISMQYNNEGFLMPIIDKDLCIDCGKCDKVCPYINASITDIEQFSLKDFNGKNVYLYYSKEEGKINSASGGFVYDLSLYFVKRGGYVCGCVWDDKLKACHIISHKSDDLSKMQSSKYVQSDLGLCFKVIKQHLINSNKVLFCGTPCQAAALKQYIGKTTGSNNLTTVCLICHGVPSPLVWERYKSCLEKKYKSKLLDVNMRDKTASGYSLPNARFRFRKSMSGSSEQYVFTRYWPTYLSDPYIYLFTDSLFLRNSCYHCIYKSDHSGADIIAGDFHASTSGAGNLGCSSLIVLTKQGEEMVKQLGGVIKNSSINEVGTVNSMIYESVRKHPSRECFFSKMKHFSDSDMSFLTDFLPYKFYVKRVLNGLGLFNVVRRIIR